MEVTCDTSRGCAARCCSPVALPFSQGEIADCVPNDDAERRTRHWVLEELIPISSEEGFARSPHLRGQTLLADGHVAEAHFYDCRNFDHIALKCMDYENRPNPCRKFPWAEDDPNPAILLPPDCSYHDAVPVRWGVKR